MKNSLEIKGGQRPFRGLYEHNIQVDSFSKASPIYILSHFHKDHCLGIDNLQKTGGFVIYCSQVTKELLMLQYTKLRENSFVIAPGFHSRFRCWKGQLFQSRERKSR